MYCSRAVFRCFKSLERCADTVTGAAGPVFVTLAIILISIGILCFFEVILPTLAFSLIAIPTCTLIAFNLMMHYYYVCTVSPGFNDQPSPVAGTGVMWAKPKRPEGNTSPQDVVMITPAEMAQCRKCVQMRPERSHHCRICKRCILKFDHHCPWINQCVGIHNERHFVLFMAYLVLSTFCFNILGFTKAKDAMGFTWPMIWPYHMPATLFVMIYILCVVLCFAVGVMLSFHLWGVAKGETSVEAQDHEHYAKVAKSRGETFVNCYDMGKRKNLELFFNMGPSGGYSITTLFFPFRIMPYTDGRAWARKGGLERHDGVRRGEELTDEEDEGFA